MTTKQTDVCEVCGEIREEHGDKKHEFSTDGQLITLKPEVARATPPTTKGQQLSNDPVARLHLRLIERLVAKKLLDGNDLLYVFGSDNASD